MNLELRSQILEFSLTIESFANSLIGVCFGLTNEDLVNSKSFGYKSSCLSFNQKLNLLLDINMIDRKEEWKFQTLMEVRNKFLHVAEIDSFVKCFEYIEKKSKLLKEFPSEEEVEENKLNYATTALSLDIMNIYKNAHSKILNKSIEDGTIRLQSIAAVKGYQIFQTLAKRGKGMISVKICNKLFQQMINELGDEMQQQGHVFRPFAPVDKKFNYKMPDFDIQ
jgi:hypothetical protein